MKFQIVMAIFLVACSSAQKSGQRNEDAPSKVTKESFRKERALSNNEVQDFYSQNISSENPALQDETLDRFSSDEMSAMKEVKDPLVELSLLCSGGDFKKAFSLASRNFNRYQKVATYWNQVANCHLNEGSHRKALLFYNKALEVSPNYVPALNNIGVMYTRMNQDQKALVAFERANKASRFAKTPRYNLAKMYLVYGLADSALPILRGLLDASPSDMELRNSVANAYFLMSNYQEALQHFNEIPKNQWSRPEVGLNLVVTYKKLGKIEEASKLMGQIDKPKSASLSRYYSTIEKYLGDSL